MNDTSTGDMRDHFKAAGVEVYREVELLKYELRTLKQDFEDFKKSIGNLTLGARGRKPRTPTDRLSADVRSQIIKWAETVDGPISATDAVAALTSKPKASRMKLLFLAANTLADIGWERYRPMINGKRRYRYQKPAGGFTTGA